MKCSARFARIKYTPTMNQLVNKHILSAFPVRNELCVDGTECNFRWQSMLKPKEQYLIMVLNAIAVIAWFKAETHVFKPIIVLDDMLAHKLALLILLPLFCVYGA